MSTPPPPKPQLPDAPLAIRVLRALGEATANSPAPANQDFLGSLSEAEKKVKEIWPNASPTGDGVSYLDQIMETLANRIKWQARIAIGGEIAWLLSKLAILAVVLGVAWNQLLT